LHKELGLALRQAGVVRNLEKALKVRPIVVFAPLIAFDFADYVVAGRRRYTCRAAIRLFTGTAEIFDVALVVRKRRRMEQTFRATAKQLNASRMQQRYFPKDWQAPHGRLSAFTRPVIILVVAGAIGFLAWFVTDMVRNPDPDARAAEAQRAVADTATKAMFLDPIDGPSRLDTTIKDRISAAKGFFHLKTWGEEYAVVSIPLTASYAIVCNGHGLEIAIAGANYEHTWTKDEQGQPVDMGADDGVMIVPASFTDAECQTLATSAEATMTSIVTAGR
jgi:hypothetical protein